MYNETGLKGREEDLHVYLISLSWTISYSTQYIFQCLLHVSSGHGLIKTAPSVTITMAFISSLI